MLILQRIKTSENLAKHFNIVSWWWRHIWRHQKWRLHTKTDSNESFSKAKNM